jgi:hypothetical protein
MTEIPTEVLGKLQRVQAFAVLPALEENAEWYAIAPLSRRRVRVRAPVTLPIFQQFTGK